MSVLGLEGKVVLITGAAAGIGAATAALFAEEGARVALCDRAPDFGAGDDPFQRSFDVRDADATRAFVDAVAERFGRIDVVVNNAGGTFAAPLLEVSAKGEAALIAENFTQVTHLLRVSVPHMPEGSSIVNVTSIEAHRAAPAYAVYAAMKAAQANLTQSLALELASRGIRVNAMAPDVLETEGTGSLSGGVAASSRTDGGDGVGPTRMYHPSPTPPLGHWGTARDGAGAILFLASDLARFVTGVTLHVDGGNLAAGGWHRSERGT
ncbi:MAG: SDR family NAD(P)-dependent oxidoreductase [Acidimicrobiales bacterium]